ncbi:MAG: insulinase family protein [Planctomycetes bacterium]|nr:insulinase family protein [Planctomycetota bacterium]
MKVEVRTDTLLGESLHAATLSGGLRAFVVPKRAHARKIAVLGVKYGSIDTAYRRVSGPALASAGPACSTPAGVAHYLEHQLFKKESGDLFEEFARHGGSSNAGTDHASTCYYVSATDRFPENLEVLLQLVFSPYFVAANVDRERPIIEQEIRMYEDTPDSKITLNLLDGLYHRHPVRAEIAGTVESIREIGPSTLAECHRLFYRPANVTFVAAGDLEPRAVLAQVERALQRLAPGGGLPCKGSAAATVPAGNEAGFAEGAVEPVYPEEPALPRSPWTEGRMHVSRPKLFLGFKDPAPGVDGERLLDIDVATDMALDLMLGRGSRLGNRLYEDGLVDDEFSYGYMSHPTFAHSCLGGDTDDPERLRDALLTGIRRARKEGVKRRDFERMRRKCVGKYIRQFDAAESAAFAVLGSHLRGVDAFDAFRRLRRLTLRAVRERLAEHFDESRMSASVLRPLEGNGEEGGETGGGRGPRRGEGVKEGGA